MILVDYNNLVYRCLFSATMGRGQQQLSSKDYGGLLLHLVITNIEATKKQFERKYGEVVICIDSPLSWRHRIYPEYKKGRKRDSNIDWNEFFTFLNHATDEMAECFGYKFVKAFLAEADDIISVLSEQESGNHIIISEDKDFIQLYSDTVKVYRPISKNMLEVPEQGIEWFKKYHICLGDKVDNILSIKDNTIPTPEYQKFLLESEGKKEEDISPFTGTKYKNGGFGPKSVEKWLENFEQNMKDNPKMAERFKENEILIDLKKIPEVVKNDILEVFSDLETKSEDRKKVLEFLEKYNLNKLKQDLGYSQDIFNAWVSCDTTCDTADNGELH